MSVLGWGAHLESLRTQVYGLKKSSLFISVSGSSRWFYPALQTRPFSSHGQNDFHVLHQQTGRSALFPSMSGSNPAVGVLHYTHNQSCSIIPSGNTELAGGSSQQIFLLSLQVVFSTGHYEEHLPMIGDFPYKPICYLKQQKMPPGLLPVKPLPRVSYRCLPVIMDKSHILCLSSYPNDIQGSDEDQAGLSANHPHSPSVAQPMLVRRTLKPFGGNPTTASTTPGPDLPRLWLAAQSEPQLS